MNTDQNQVQVVKPSDKAMEFLPFGAADKIKLTVQIVQNLIAVPTRSGKTCSEKDALKFMMLCQAQRLNPFAGDAHLVGYDSNDKGPTFSLITAHQAFLKRAEQSEQFNGMTSGIILVDGDNIVEREGDFHLQSEAQNVVGGWAKVFLKNRTIPVYRRIRLDRFNSGFAQWKVDPAGMIVKCAESDALRSAFPTLLGGLYMREELVELDGPTKPAISTPIFSAPARTVIEAPKAAAQAEDEIPGAEVQRPAEAPKAKRPYTRKAQWPGEGTAPAPAAPVADPVAQPAPVAPTAPPAESSFNLAKALRGMCGTSGLTETALLKWMESDERCSPGCPSLDEAYLEQPEQLKAVYDAWSDVVDIVKGGGK